MLSRKKLGCAAALIGLVAAGCDTVPLVAPTNSTVTLTSGSVVLPPGGTTEVTAYVAESAGTAVQNGTTVHFSTNLGRVEPADVQTRNGYAAATFFAGDVSGVAEVRANSGSAGGGGTDAKTASNVVSITVGAAGASAVFLAASPGALPAGGGTTTIIASVLDANGNRMRGVPVTFSTDQGTLSATSATTDANGDARVQLTTSREATVTAQAGAKTATLKILINAGITITVSPSTATGTTATTFVFTITPAQGSFPREVVIDFGDGETTGLGAIVSATQVAHKYLTPGTMVVRVNQSNTDGSTSAATLIIVVTP